MRKLKVPLVARVPFWLWMGTVAIGNLYGAYVFTRITIGERGALHALAAVGVIASATFLIAFAVDEFKVALFAMMSVALASMLGVLIAFLVNLADPPAIFAPLVADPVTATANVIAAGSAVGGVAGVIFARRFVTARISSRS